MSHLRASPPSFNHSQGSDIIYLIISFSHSLPTTIVIYPFLNNMSASESTSIAQPSKLNQPLPPPPVKFHLSPSLLQALQYLDSHQNSLSGPSQVVSDQLLNIIDRFPEQFVAMESDDDEPEPPSKSAHSSPTDPESTPTPSKSTNPESSKALQATSTFLPPLLSSLPSDEEIAKNMLHQSHVNTCKGCIELTQVHNLIKLLRELQYPHPTHLHSLLKNTSLCSHEEMKSNYTPEFAAHLQFLREKQQKREFEAIMSNLPSRSAPVQSQEDRGVMKKAMEMVGLPINMIAVAGTISFVFYWVATVANPHNRLFHWSASIIGLLLGFIIEVLLFVIRDFNESRYNKHKTVMTEKQEKKQFLDIIRGNIMYGRIPSSGVSKLPTFNPHTGSAPVGPQQPVNDDKKEQKDKYSAETKKQR